MLINNQKDISENEHLRFILEAAGIGIWDLDPIQGQVIWDKRCRQLFGFAEDEIATYEQVLKYIHPEDAKIVEAAIQKALNPTTKRAYEVRYRTIGNDGNIRWILSKGKAYFNDEGVAIRFAGTSQDITETVQDREKAIVSEQIAQVALKGSNSGYFRILLATDEMEYSPGCARILTGDENKSLGHEDLKKYIHPEDRSIRAKAFELSTKTGKLDYEARTIWDDGSIHWVRATGTYFNNTYITGTIHDTTAEVLARKRLEEIEASLLDAITAQRILQLSLEQEVELRTEELLTVNEELSTANKELNEANKQLLHSNEELAQYAYVASHDLQEPLRKIRLFSGMLEGQENLPADNKRLINKIAESAQRMSMLIRDLLDFSRLLKREIPIHKVDLSKVFSDVISDFELTIEEKQATVRIGRLPVIEAVALQMNQLFYNLLSNALKFVSPGITPEIIVDAQILEHEAVAQYISNPLTGSNYYHITFADNGIGFETKYADQIFEVFKRLHGRAAYPGSGIGLALCKRIVGNHNGHIYVESETGRGTTFHLILPDRSS